jgi:hypothetical protein
MRAIALIEKPENQKASFSREDSPSDSQFPSDRQLKQKSLHIGQLAFTKKPARQAASSDREACPSDRYSNQRSFYIRQSDTT